MGDSADEQLPTSRARSLFVVAAVVIVRVHARVAVPARATQVPFAYFCGAFFPGLLLLFLLRVPPASGLDTNREGSHPRTTPAAAGSRGRGRRRRFRRPHHCAQKKRKRRRSVVIITVIVAATTR